MGNTSKPLPSTSGARLSMQQAQRAGIPVALLTSSGIIAKTIALYWNYDFYGFSNELIGAYLINILILVYIRV